MSSKLKKKSNQKYFGYSTKETKMVMKRSVQKVNQDKAVLSSYKDFVVMGYDLLHIHFGFGLKRLQRTERLLNSYLDRVADKEFNGKQLAYFLKEKYKVDVDRICKRLPLNQVQKMYYRENGVSRVNLYHIVQASLFNYLSIMLTILKTAFRFSDKQIKQFIDDFIDLFDTLSRVEQFSLTIPVIIEGLADETKYVCDY